jgi:molecular chaperone GrpE
MSKKPTIKDFQQKVNELTEALQRERADAINVRRRAEEERAHLAKYYKAMIVQDLLPAIDNLERALMHIPKDLKDHDYVKGIQGVAKQFDKVFSDLGVQRIKTVGERFDPKYHEAVHMEEGEGTVEVVCEELTSGYQIDNEIIRHARVKVKMDKDKEK